MPRTSMFMHMSTSGIHLAVHLDQHGSSCGPLPVFRVPVVHPFPYPLLNIGPYFRVKSYFKYLCWPEEKECYASNEFVVTVFFYLFPTMNRNIPLILIKSVFAYYILWLCKCSQDDFQILLTIAYYCITNLVYCGVIFSYESHIYYNLQL